MAYTPTVWKDHILSDSNYNMSENADGTVRITPSGTVVQQGTKMSAANFNHMEKGISDAHEKLENVYNKTEVDSKLGDIQTVLESVVEVDGDG